MEDWRDIEGYRGIYQVSSLGKVRSLDRIDSAGRRLKSVMLKPALTRGEYLMVGLTKNGKARHFRINRLVAQAFIPNPENLPHAGHKNDDKRNNELSNLYWTDAGENNTHNGKHIKVGEKVGKPIIGIRGMEKISFNSSLDAKRKGFNASAIRNCLTGRSKTHKGYHWTYKNAI